MLDAALLLDGMGIRRGRGASLVLLSVDPESIPFHPIEALMPLRHSLGGIRGDGGVVFLGVGAQVLGAGGAGVSVSLSSGPLPVVFRWLSCCHGCEPRRVVFLPLQRRGVLVNVKAAVFGCR